MKDKLEIDSVILEFGRERILQDVYLNCETGKVTGILGRNGSGKTCLLNILYGVLLPTDRSVRINGISLHKNSRDPSTMRYLPQHGFIPKFLTVRKVFKDFNLDFSLFSESFPEFMKYFNLRLRTLSGGERRLIEIYTILMADSRFCLLDEPFSHIMPVHIETIKKLILDQKQQKGIMITDHLYDHILDICDDTYLIASGKTFPVRDFNDLAELGYINPEQYIGGAFNLDNNILLADL